MTQQAARPRLPFDTLLFGATLALVVVGLWMVFDSSYVKTLDNAKMGFDAFYFVKKQAVGVIVGLMAMLTLANVGYWRLRVYAVPLMLVSLGLLCAVWLPGIGHRENNASRWLHLGPLTIQPSELAKVALVLYLAALLSRAHCKVRDLFEGLGPPLLVSGITLLLIEREPDLGTAAVLFLAVVTQLFLAGARKRHIALILSIAGLAVMLMISGFGHRQGRIQTFLNPESDKKGIGYQIYHSRLAVGSGQLLGMGLGQGREKYYLPQGNTDFIFATIAEELGFVRTLPILGLLFFVGCRGFAIALQTRDRFGALLAGGIAALISWQALINIAVATASIPATGVPLPFISYGSSSLVFLLAGIGLLLNIAQNPLPPGHQE